MEENFGNQCWDGNYTGPGVNHADDFLYKQCPDLQRDLYYCQTQTDKKLLLSLGGAAEGANYDLSGEVDGEDLAIFLWGAYGPLIEGYTGVRPLDRGYGNTDSSIVIEIDGFDFDIERASSGKSLCKSGKSSV